MTEAKRKRKRGRRNVPGAQFMRMHRSLSRVAFEKMLGGDWSPVKDTPSANRNGKYETWRGPGNDCFVRNLKSRATKSGRTWRDVALTMGLTP